MIDSYTFFRRIPLFLGMERRLRRRLSLDTLAAVDTRSDSCFTFASYGRLFFFLQAAFPTLPISDNLHMHVFMPSETTVPKSVDYMSNFLISIFIITSEPTVFKQTPQTQIA